MPIQRPPVEPRHKVSPVEIYWKTVTYRTVAMYAMMVLAVLIAVSYLIFPEAYSGTIAKVSEAIGAHTAPTAELTAKQAKFVNLDGNVQVKKVNSVQWVTADYRMALDKGDLIRTIGDGAARITFVDGTTYTVKIDSFVTVEENSIDRDSATSVAMHISSGAVDLATGTWDSPRSKAEVSFANARHRCRRIAAPPCAAIRRPARRKSPCPPAPPNFHYRWTPACRNWKVGARDCAFRREEPWSRPMCWRLPI